MPRPPMMRPPLYSGTPPPKKIMPPAIWFCPPDCPRWEPKLSVERITLAQAPPGVLGLGEGAERAVDSAAASRLKAFAAYALAFAMAWLPGPKPGLGHFDW